MEANRKAYQEARKRELIAKQAREKRLEAEKKLKAEEEKKLQEQKKNLWLTLKRLRAIVRPMASSEDAIATCVQREINLREIEYKHSNSQTKSTYYQQVQLNSINMDRT